jgi:RNA polymerase sigma-70 factor (ECF subfamily)
MAGSEPAQKVRRNEAEERRLIEAAQSDRSRFADVYERYFDLVYAYIARRIRDRVETEDLTAEVFRKALQNLDRFKWRGAPFSAWLFRIASNLIADRAKREGRDREVGLDDSLEAASIAAGTGSNGPGTSRPQTSQQTDLEENERRVQIFRLVSELAADQRRVILMRFAEEKSVREIAAALERSEGAIKQLQFRALQNLRERLKL